MIAKFKKISSDNLQKLLDDPSRLEDVLFEDNDGSNSYDLDKAWHAIHFMLNGSVQGVSTISGELIVGGKPISEEDMGYGPARYFEVSKISDISAELETITNEAFFENFDAMLNQGNEIYSGFQNTDEDKEYIASYFSGLKEFCKKTAQENKCLISYMA